jgi:hypothetical protein
MSRIDDGTLREVGRFAIECSTFDALITQLAADIIECTESSIAKHLTEQLTLGRKLERIKKVCTMLATAHGLLDTNSHKTLLDKIGLAETVANHRNTVIHGEVTNKRGKAPTIQLKKQSVELSPSALSVEIDKIDRASDVLVTAYIDFMSEIRQARDAAAKIQGPRHA